MRIGDLVWQDLLSFGFQQAILNIIEDYASDDWKLDGAEVNGSDGAYIWYVSKHHNIMFEISDKGDDVVVSVGDEHGEPLFEYVSKAVTDSFKRNGTPFEVLTYNSNDSLELFIAKLMKNIEQHSKSMNESIRRRWD